MELDIIKLIKELRNQLRKKPKKEKAETIILQKVEKAKPTKEPKHKVADIVVYINCKPMTLKEVAMFYKLEPHTVYARYRVGNRGKLLTRPSHRNSA